MLVKVFKSVNRKNTKITLWSLAHFSAYSFDLSLRNYKKTHIVKIFCLVLKVYVIIIIIIISLSTGGWEAGGV